MVLQALVEAAKKVDGPCTIVSDHAFMVGIAQRGMTPRMCKPLWEELDAATASKFEWRKTTPAAGCLASTLPGAASNQSNSDACGSLGVAGCSSRPYRCRSNSFASSRSFAFVLS
jgi:hypothetical protein